MTASTITRAQLKAMINRDEWYELGKLFSFTPVFMLSEGGKKYIIDWRCVPPSMSEILWKTETAEPIKPKPHFAEQTRIPQAPARLAHAPATKVKSPNEMRQLEHFGDAIVNLAARVVAKKMSHPTVYFLCAQNLASNKNLATAGFKSGAQAEVEIGKVFVESGLEAAYGWAEEIIKRTTHYIEHHKK